MSLPGRARPRGGPLPCPSARAPLPPGSIRTWTWPAFLLIGLLTVATPGGPLLLMLMLRGGIRPGWPPDRDVEWWAFGLTVGGYLVLLVACLLVGLVRWRQTLAAQPQGHGAAQGEGQ